jgi:hypothetical protein
LFIGNNGNVGIGTTSPASKLHIGVAPTASANYGTLSIGGGYFDGSTTGKFAGSASGTSIAVNEASGYTGNLMNLEVNGTSYFKVDNSGTVTTPYQIVALNQIQTPIIYGASGVNFTYFNGSTVVSALSYNNLGNVGIGTTAPAQKLDVYGTAQISYDATHYGQIVADSSGQMIFNSIGNLKFTPGSGLNYFNTAGKNNRFFVYDYSDAYNPYLVLDAHNLQLNSSKVDPTLGQVNFTDNGNSYLTGGNVGIGTTSPAANLVVNGTTGQNLFQIATSTNQNIVVVNGAGLMGVGMAPNDTSTGLSVQGSSQTSILKLVYGSQTAHLGTYGDGVLAMSELATPIIRDQGSGMQFQTFSSANGFNFETNNVSALDILGNGNVGIGTTTPATKLTIAGGLSFYGTIPTLSSCGTSPTITQGSTDNAGEITEGSIATGCTITFAAAKTNAPFCTVTEQSGLAASYTISTSAITITNIGALSSTKLDYHCVMNNN